MNQLADIDNTSRLDTQQLIHYGAASSGFFCSTFFPNTARMKMPEFSEDVWRRLESRRRLVSLQMFRGSGKTSTLRMYTAKRIAYGFARTVLYIGKSEGHAIRSISWIRKQVDNNRLFADTFKLRAGDKWQDVEAEIYHEAEDTPIWLMAMGMTGSVRGVNRDDFRPDLIVCDDIIDDENAGTEEQREKLETRLYGAIIESLAPASESPDAKLVMLQTPIHRDDASMKTEKDKSWSFARYGCWTPETMNLPINKQKSIWPERWSDEVLQQEKRAAIQRNKLSVFTREKECRITTPELAAFKPDWLQHFEELPEEGVRVLVLDPVPPPSDKQIEQGLEKKDFECLHVVQRTGDKFYSVHYELSRGHEPTWTISTLFSLYLKYHPQRVVIESVAYQRTLSWLVKQAQEQQKLWFPIKELDDKRSKYNRIVDALAGTGAAGKLFVRYSADALHQQFQDYPRVSHDDCIETFAIGVAELNTPWGKEASQAVAGQQDYDDDEDDEVMNCWGAP